MTLAEWSAKTGILPTHPTTERGAVSVVVRDNLPELSSLWDVTDYVVSEVSGTSKTSVIWLLPRPESKRQLQTIPSEIRPD